MEAFSLCVAGWAVAEGRQHSAVHALAGTPPQRIQCLSSIRMPLRRGKARTSCLAHQ